MHLKVCKKNVRVIQIEGIGLTGRNYPKGMLARLYQHLPSSSLAKIKSVIYEDFRYINTLTTRGMLLGFGNKLASSKEKPSLFTQAISSLERSI